MFLKSKSNMNSSRMIIYEKKFGGGTAPRT